MAKRNNPEPTERPSLDAITALLQLAMKTVNKQHGEGTVAFFDPRMPLPTWERISTGSLGLDLATGGGIPRGQCTEISGAEASGKSTLAIHIAKNVQAQGGIVAYIDAENKFNMRYAQALGITFAPPHWIFSQPSSAEAALDTARSLIETGYVDLVVIDSIAALAGASEIAKESFGDGSMMVTPRLLGDFMRVVLPMLRKTNTTLLLINQLRDAVNAGGYGKRSTTPGGRAVKFRSIMRIETRIVELQKVGDMRVGQRVRASVIKNQTAMPYQEAEYVIRFGEGIDWADEAIDLALRFRQIRQQGAYYEVEGTRLHGRPAVRKWLRDHPECVERWKVAWNTGEVAPIETEEETDGNDRSVAAPDGTGAARPPSA